MTNGQVIIALLMAIFFIGSVIIAFSKNESEAMIAAGLFALAFCVLIK